MKKKIILGIGIIAVLIVLIVVICTNGTKNDKESTNNQTSEIEVSTKTIGELKGGEAVTQKTVIKEENTGYTITIPAGYKVTDDSATEIKDGIVVSDNEGNEFVWVPVQNAILDLSNDSTALSTETNIKAKIQLEMTEDRYPMAVKNADGNYFGILYEFSQQGDITEISLNKYWTPLYETNSKKTYAGEPLYLKGNEEADESSHNTVGITEESLQTEFNEMIESIEESKGYYIGRYEISGTIEKAESKADAKTLAQAQPRLEWYEFYEAAKNYKGNSNVKSSMLWGSQYDQMIIWMVKNDLGKYITTDDIPNDENVNGDKINNIYNLYGGNGKEWTLEGGYMGNYYYRVTRGGYGDSYNVSSIDARSNSGCAPGSTSYGYGSRLSLQVK